MVGHQNKEKFLTVAGKNDLGRRDDGRGTDVLMATKEAREQWKQTSHVLRDSSGQPEIPHSGKIAARNERKTSTFRTAKNEFLLSLQPR